MSADFLRLDPEQLAGELERRGHEWADKNAAAELLEEMKGPRLSQIANEHKATVPSVAAAEMVAKASEAYGAHIASMVEARRVANRAKASLEGYRAFVELLRSRSAAERAAMSMR